MLVETLNAPPIRADIFYEEDGRYRIVVYHEDRPLEHLTAFVASTFEPRFGIDASDMEMIKAEAEKLALEIEKKKPPLD